MPLDCDQLLPSNPTFFSTANLSDTWIVCNMFASATNRLFNTTLTNWNIHETSNACSWQRVTCNTQQQVRKIQIPLSSSSSICGYNWINFTYIPFNFTRLTLTGETFHGILNPASFPANSTYNIDISNSNIEILSDDVSNLQKLTSLLYLTISNCPNIPQSILYNLPPNIHQFRAESMSVANWNETVDSRLIFANSIGKSWWCCIRRQYTF